MKPEDLVREYVKAYESSLREANRDSVPAKGTPEHVAWLEHVFSPLMRREHELLAAMREWAKANPGDGSKCEFCSDSDTCVECKARDAA